MITLADIKQALFPDEGVQEAFMADLQTNNLHLADGNFDDKLASFFEQADEAALQRLLSPYLRARLFKYRMEGETSYIRAYTQARIEVQGVELFEQMRLAMGETDYVRRYKIAQFDNNLNPRKALFDEQISHARTYARAHAEVVHDFSDLKNQFIKYRGTDIWDAIYQPESSSQEDYERYVAHHGTFFDEFTKKYTESPENFQALLTRAHKVSPLIKAYDRFRFTFCKKWGEQLWKKYCTTHINDLAPNHTPVSSETVEEHMEQTPLSLVETRPADDSRSPALQYFIEQKRKFLAEHGPNAWEEARKSRKIALDALAFAYQYKTEFIQFCGAQEWEMIMYPPEIVEKWKKVQEEFATKWRKTDKWTPDLWTQYCTTIDQNGTPIDEASLDPEILADFNERKNQFITQSQTQFCDEDPLRTVLTYPKTLTKTTALIAHFKNIFVQKWGKADCVTYFNHHNHHGVWATEDELKHLGAILGLRIRITDINPIRTETYWLLGEEELDRPNTPFVHFYCEDNGHYYIHEGGYWETNGNGNCFYNGLSQWLSLLLKGQTPRRIMVLPDPGDTNIQSVIAVQQALLTESSNPASVQHTELVSASDDTTHSASQPGTLAHDNSDHVQIDEALVQILLKEELKITSIRKELALPMEHATAQVLGTFIQNKAHALIHIIRAKKLPFANRIPLLEHIARLAQELHTNPEHQGELLKLKTLLWYVTNTAYLPHTQDNSEVWTITAYRENITILQNTIALDEEHYPSSIFGGLRQAIIETNFSQKEPEPFITQLINRATSSYSPARFDYNQPVVQTEYEDEDYISAALCVAGIFLLITSITFLISLLIVALTSGFAGLGMMLMQTGLAAMATALGGVIGLSAPTTAMILATGLTCVAAGLGFTLFKDFAPRNMPPLETFMPSLPMF